MFVFRFDTSFVLVNKNLASAIQNESSFSTATSIGIEITYYYKTYYWYTKAIHHMQFLNPDTIQT